MKEIETRLRSHFLYIKRYFGIAQALKLALMPRLASRLGKKGPFVKNLLRFQESVVGDIIEKYRRLECEKGVSIAADCPVWCLWLQGEAAMPEVIRECVASIRRQVGERLILLDAESIGKYVDVPEDIRKKFQAHKISPSHYSDIVRLLLLSKYGGWWIDSALFMTHPFEPQGRLFMPAFEISADPYLSMFQGRWWFGCFAAVPHYKLVDYMLECLLEYWRRYDAPVTYLMFDGFMRLAYDNFPDVAADIDRFPKCALDLHRSRYTFDKVADIDKYKKLVDNNVFLSLTWRFPYPKEINGKPTYYGLLLSQFNKCNES